MAKYGVVVATDDGIATVEITKDTVCADCSRKNKIGACDACSNKDEFKAERLVAYNQAGARIGDKVEFVKAKGVNILFTLVVFVLPIVAALLSYFVAANFIDDASVKNKIATAAFFISMAFAGGYSYFASLKKRCDYSITAIIE